MISEIPPDTGQMLHDIDTSTVNSLPSPIPDCISTLGVLIAPSERTISRRASAIKVRFQELYVRGGGVEDPDGADTYRLEASGLLDLEPALRDAIVLELPLSPRCEDGCQGLCVECGVRLADAEPGHSHERRGAMWAALKDFRSNKEQ